MSDVIAIAVSDIHLTEKAPPARAGEPNWYTAMKRPLDQLRDIAYYHNHPPILYAGDIFDKWNPSPELISFAIKNLPKGFSIPGQHDLSYHNFEDRGRTGYWTLVTAGILKDISHKKWDFEHMTVFGLPWGSASLSGDYIKTPKKKIALIHAYIWKDGAGYFGATSKSHVDTFLKSFEGFDVVLFGDNHKGFMVTTQELTLVNCGGFMRRKTDEIEYKPCVTLIYKNWFVERVPLDVSCDIIKEPEFNEDVHLQSDELRELLTTLKNSVNEENEINFEAALQSAGMSLKLSKRAQDIIAEVLTTPHKRT